MAKKRSRFAVPKFSHPFQKCRSAQFVNQINRLYRLETRALKCAARFFPRGTAVIINLRSDEDAPREAEIVGHCATITDGVGVKFTGQQEPDRERTFVVPWYSVFLPTDWALRKELIARRGWTCDEKKPKRKRKGAATR